MKLIAAKSSNLFGCGWFWLILPLSQRYRPWQRHQRSYIPAGYETLWSFIPNNKGPIFDGILGIDSAVLTDNIETQMRIFFKETPQWCLTFWNHCHWWPVTGGWHTHFSGREPFLTATYRGPEWGPTTHQLLEVLNMTVTIGLPVAIPVRFSRRWPPGFADVSCFYRWWGCIYFENGSFVSDTKDTLGLQLWWCLFLHILCSDNKKCKYIGDDGFNTCLHLSRWDFGKSCHPTTRDILRAQKEAGNVFSSISPGVTDDVHASHFQVCLIGFRIEHQAHWEVISGVLKFWDTYLINLINLAKLYID